MNDAGWADARVAAHRAARSAQPERRPLAACLGCTLAEPLVARTPLPPFDAAAMDGFAVCGPPPWRLLPGRLLPGRLLPGRLLPGRSGVHLEPGTAVRVATGAALPPEVSGVLAQEVARLEPATPPRRAATRNVADPSGSAGGALLHGTVSAGQHVRRAGEEAAAGEQLLAAGATLGAVAIGLAASAGADELVVRRAPTVAILVTGQELVTRGPGGPGRVRDALGPMLPGLVRALGGRPVGRVVHSSDAPGSLARTVQRLAARVDVLVSTGASGPGATDHLRDVLARLGGELVVEGVACRPGHPQLLARLSSGTLVVGLPGNPLAALVGALTLLAPVLSGGRGTPLPELRPGVLAHQLPAPGAWTRLVPVGLTPGGYRPLAGVGSAMLRGVAQAVGFVVLPPGGEPVPAGAGVEVLDLPAGVC